MITESEFHPAWWLPEAHSQTLWPYFMRPVQRRPVEPERLELPDGDFIDLCWTKNRTGPVVALFHGLEGSIQSPYAARMMAAIEKLQWCGVFMHFRGCSGEPNRLIRSYHSGDTTDIGFLLDVLAKRYPNAPLFAIAYSLGGNALLKYLGERGDDTPLTAAAAVSVPFMLAEGAIRLNRGFSRIYQRRLIRSLQNKVVTKFDGRMPGFSREDVSLLDTFYKFDERITAPLHGFAGADDYYARCSSRGFLANIRKPVLILHSKDDPFLTPDAIPAASELSEAVLLELSGRGGHVGFVSGSVPGKPVYWLEQRIPEFLAEFCP